MKRTIVRLFLASILLGTFGTFLKIFGIGFLNLWLVTVGTVLFWGCIATALYCLVRFIENNIGK